MTPLITLFLLTLPVKEPPKGAAPTTKTEAPSQYGAVILDSLEATGLIRLNGTTISKALKINGSLIAQHADLDSLDITGQANLTSSTVKSTAYVMGSLQAIKTAFQKPLTVLSQKALFTACKLDEISIRQDASYKGKQVIELKQSTLVNGPIHFESGKGEVHIYPGSQVLGPITGGKAIKKP